MPSATPARLLLSLSLSLGLASLAGCGSTVSGGTPPSDAATDTPVTKSDAPARTDVSAPTPEAGVEAGPSETGVDAGPTVGKWDALPPFPQVVNGGAGGLATPTVVAVFFSNEDTGQLPDLEKVYTDLGTSNYWKSLAEYGVGTPTIKTIVLPSAAPAMIDDTLGGTGFTALQNLLLAQIASGALPSPNGSTVYLLNFPITTVLTSNGSTCGGFDGYHADMKDSMNNVIGYGVIPGCIDQGSTRLVTFSSTVSHEVVETVTDAFPNNNAGWYMVDNAHLFFDLANNGSEIGDMCQNDPEATYVFSDMPYTVQRFWSNMSAAAGHDPCVPQNPNLVFFNAVPELPDTGLFNYFGGGGTPPKVDSVAIPVGMTKTVWLDLYSDGTVTDWTVSVMDNNVFNGANPSQALLSFSLPVTTGNNGTRLPLEITVKKAGNGNNQGEVTNVELFAIISSQGTGPGNQGPSHYWYGAVTN